VWGLKHRLSLLHGPIWIDGSWTTFPRRAVVLELASHMSTRDPILHVIVHWLLECGLGRHQPYIHMSPIATARLLILRWHHILLAYSCCWCAVICQNCSWFRNRLVKCVAMLVMIWLRVLCPLHEACSNFTSSRSEVSTADCDRGHIPRMGVGSDALIHLLVQNHSIVFICDVLILHGLCERDLWIGLKLSIHGLDHDILLLHIS